MYYQRHQQRWLWIFMSGTLKENRDSISKFKYFKDDCGEHISFERCHMIIRNNTYTKICTSWSIKHNARTKLIGSRSTFFVVVELGQKALLITIIIIHSYEWVMLCSWLIWSRIEQNKVNSSVHILFNVYICWCG
jgi:hypothetical protein